MQKSKLTRILALIVSGGMAVSALPITALAEEPTTWTLEGNENGEPIAALSEGEQTSDDTTGDTTPTDAKDVQTLGGGVPFSNPPYGETGYKVAPPSGPQVTNDFQIGGHAFVDPQYPNVAVVAQDLGNQFGYMWYKEQLDLSAPFETEMKMYLGKKYPQSTTPQIADGMTFTLHNDPKGLGAYGMAGGGLGVYSGNYNGTIAGITNMLTIEFDTYKNDDPEDASGNGKGHIAAILTKDGRVPTAAEHVPYIGFDVKQDWVQFTAKWEPNGAGGGTLYYTFDGHSGSKYVPDYVAHFGSNKVYWGFTGSTGGSTAIHAAAIEKLPEQKLAANLEVQKNGIDLLGGAHVDVHDDLTVNISSRATNDADPETISPVIIEYRLPAGVALTCTEATITKNGAVVGTVPILPGGIIRIETGVSLEKLGDTVNASFTIRVDEPLYGKHFDNEATISTKTTAPENTNMISLMVYASYRVEYFYENENGQFVNGANGDAFPQISAGTVVSNYTDKAGPGYEVDPAQTAGSLTVTANQNDNVWEVYYRCIRHNITYEVSGNGSIDRTVDEVIWGKTITPPTPVPDPGNSFSHWEDETGKKYQPEDFANLPIENDLKLTAVFEKGKAPTIEETSRTASIWTNQSVTVDYLVKSQDQKALKHVSVDGMPVSDLGSGKITYSGSVTFIENGLVKVDAETIVPVSAIPLSIDVDYIDKIHPTIDKSNMPERADTAAEIINAVKFDDPKDKDGRASNIKIGTETLYIYENEDDWAPYMVIPMKDLASEWNNIPAGQYYYAISVKDNAGNYKDSNGQTASNPPTPTPEIPESPQKPTDSVVIKAKVPTISLTASNEKGPYNEGIWSNKPVSVKYDVDSNIKLDAVTENKQPQTISSSDGKTHHGETLVTKEGKHVITIEAKNGIGDAIPKEIEVWIDTKAPIVKYPSTGDTIKDMIDGMEFTDETPNVETSGVKAGSEMIIIKDKDGTEIISENKAQVEAKLKDLPTDEYTITTTVEDQAGNVSEPREIGPFPHIKDGDSGLTITIEAYKPATPTNKNVVATYKISSPIQLTNVTVDGKAVALDKTGDVTFTMNGSKVISATNAGGTETITAKVDWIDRVNPKAELPANNTMFDKTGVKLYDVADVTGKYACSGIDPEGTQLVAIPYIDGKPTTDTSKHVTITNVDETQISVAVAANLKEGTVYDLTLVGADRATNPSNTAVAKGVLYVIDKETPPTVNADEFKIEDLKSDLGSSMKSVRITNISTSTTGLTIKDVHVKIGSVDTGSGVIQTSVGASKRTVDVHFRKPANGQPVVFVVYLYTGAIVEVPYASTGPTLKTDHANLKKPTSVTVADFNAALADVEWSDGASILPAKLSVYYKNGNVMTKTTTARLAALCRAAEKEIFIVAQDISGNYHYLGQGGVAGNGLPTANLAGIKVKG